ncbi:MAG: TerL [Planctomycetaceae bacterium]|nr:TerL [Planctomycetaceae bacterium]
MKHEIILAAQGETLAKYHMDENRNVFIIGPLGSSKTFQTCQKIFKKMFSQEPNKEGVRPTRFIAVRNTNPDLETTTIRDWLALFGNLGRFVNGAPPTHKINFDLDDGTIVDSEMIFMALDRPDAVKKLRGTQATGFWLNEVKELSKSIIDMCDLRHGRYPTIPDGGIKCGWHGMVGDTNAPDVDHWIFEMAEVERPPGWVFYKQPGGVLKDGEGFKVNPDAENLANLPDDYYSAGMQGKTKEWISVNLANEYGFVSDGKPVHGDYVDSLHCLREPPPVNKPRLGVAPIIIVGCDWGLTPAAVFIQQAPSGQYQALSEVVTFDMGAFNFADIVNKHLAERYPNHLLDGWGDPSGDSRSQADEKTVFKTMRAKGLPIKPTYTNDPEIRRGAVAGPLSRLNQGHPGLVISPECVMLRKGLQGGFRYRRLMVVGEERYQETVDKNRYSHVCEAFEYALVGAGEGRKQVKPKNPPSGKAIGTYSKRRRARV